MNGVCRPIRQYRTSDELSVLVDFARKLHPDGLELHTHQENETARAFYERREFTVVGFGVSPPPESAPDVEYHWHPRR